MKMLSVLIHVLYVLVSLYGLIFFFEVRSRRLRECGHNAFLPVTSANHFKDCLINRCLVGFISKDML